MAPDSAQPVLSTTGPGQSLGERGEDGLTDVQRERRGLAAPKDKLDPTLTDLLLRDIATGQVRRTRAGARRATFGGSSMNPYDTPTLGG